MRRALVTGAAGGIGSAIADRLARDGYWLALLDVEAPHLPPSATSGGISLICDVSDPGQVEATFSRIAEQIPQLDALVNVAGINHQSPVAEMVAEDWDRVFSINVGGMFLVVKHGLSLLPTDGTGEIVNMASISGHVATPDYAAYVTSKAAVENFTYALAQEVRGQGVRVNAVAPGWVRAGFTDQALATAEDPERINQAAQAAHLLGRMAEPEEVAAPVAWLCAPRSHFITGTTLFVDGGLMRVH